jgi:hypothetical protein
MTKSTDNVPTSIRRLDNADAMRLARLVAAYDDLQTVLRCCERLVALLEGSPDDLETEALWTLTLLSYARVFASGAGEPALAEDDIADPAGDGKVREWHRVLLHLRDHHADPDANPRETYTTGVALDGAGAVNAVAVTSVRAPLVDVAAVRQAGGIAYPLIAVLDERIDPLQERIFAQMREVPATELSALDEIEVAAAS